MHHSSTLFQANQDSGKFNKTYKAFKTHLNSLEIEKVMLFFADLLSSKIVH